MPVWLYIFEMRNADEMTGSFTHLEPIIVFLGGDQRSPAASGLCSDEMSLKWNKARFCFDLIWPAPSLHSWVLWLGSGVCGLLHWERKHNLQVPVCCKQSSWGPWGQPARSPALSAWTWAPDGLPFRLRFDRESWNKPVRVTLPWTESRVFSLFLGALYISFFSRLPYYLFQPFLTSAWFSLHCSSFVFAVRPR